MYQILGMGLNQDIADKISNLSSQVLDLLPYPLTILDKEMTILFENRLMKEKYGSYLGKKCFMRWQPGNSEPINTICSNCPINKEAGCGDPDYVIRQTQDASGKVTELEIFHYPVESESERVYFEIAQERHNNGDIVNLTTLLDEIHVGITYIDGTSDNDLVLITDELPFCPTEEIQTFYVNLTVVWSTAISHKDRWPIGLFGPLPLLFIENYYSLAYSFRIPSNKPKDPRLDGYNLMLLFIMVPRQVVDSQFDRSLLENEISNYIIGFKDDLSLKNQFNSNIIKMQITNFMK